MIQEVLSNYYEQVGSSTINTVADLEVLVKKQSDLVFRS